MYCSRCGTELPDNSRYCLNCGFNIRGPKKKRWEMQKFENCSIESVIEWFNMYGDQITVLDARGNLRFEDGFLRYRWYFQYLNIRYYPEPCDYVFSLLFDGGGTSIADLIANGSPRRARENYDYCIANYETRFNIFRESHVSGGSAVAAYAIILALPK